MSLHPIGGPRLLALAIMLVATVLVPIGGAAPAGHVVLWDDPTALAELIHNRAPDALCFDDKDSDATLDAPEPVYLMAQCGEMTPYSVRIANAPSGKAPGSKVVPADPDANTTTTELEALVMLLDADDNDLFSAADTLFINMGSSESGQRVNEGDVVLTGSGAGGLVAGSTTGLNSDLEPWSMTLKQAVALRDQDGTYSYGPTDQVFLDSDDNGRVTSMDVSLNAADFGHLLRPSDGPTTFVLRANGLFDLSAPSALCYVDDDDSNSWQEEERVYLSRACGAVAKNDVRFAWTTEEIEQGYQVQTGDDDRGLFTKALPGRLRFVDLDADEEFSGPDILYYDSFGDNSKLDQRDLLMNGSRAGDIVGPAEKRLGVPLIDLSDLDQALWKFLDANGNQVYDLGDLPFLDIDNDNLATPRDIRYDVAGFGQMVTAESDIAVLLLHDGAPSDLCFDDDGDEAWEAGETIYLADQCDALKQGDLRLSGTSIVPGTMLLDGDEDDGAETATFDGALAFIDADRNTGYSLGDTVVWDVDASDDVSAGDVPLSGPAAFKPIASGDASLGKELVEFGDHRFMYVDADGSDDYGPGDLVYLDNGGNDPAYVTVLDVQLTAGAGDEMEPTMPIAPPPPASPPEAPPAEPPAAPPEPPAAPPDAPGTTSKKGTPGFEAGLLLVSIAVLVVVARRRSA